MEWLDAADVWFFIEPALYLILLVLMLVGCYVYLQRSAATHFGIAGEYEREGNLAKALKHYELAVRYSKRSGEGNAAKAKAAKAKAAKAKAAKAKAAEVRGRMGGGE